MTAGKGWVAGPLLIITLGIGSSLAVHGVMPQIDWVWVLGLGMLGILTPFMFGFDKVTFVAGSFLITTTVFSLLNETGYIDYDTEATTLVIIFGLLMLLARFLPIRTPRWFIREPVESDTPQIEHKEKTE